MSALVGAFLRFWRALHAMGQPRGLALLPFSQMHSAQTWGKRMEVGETVYTFCNRCGNNTWHKVLHIAKQAFNQSGDPDFYEESTYYTLQCGGCHGVKLREDWYGGSGDEQISFYPPPSRRKEPQWLVKWWMQTALTSNPTLMICKEVYRALQNEQPHLAAMGVRAVLEQAMIDKIGGDRRSFDENLDELYRNGHVSLLMRQRLESALDVGSATIHRGHTPSKEDLQTLVDIMEHVIQSLYVHEADVARMAGRTPPRPPKPPKATP
ncbi:DUF4145 domain-containing protein [Ralstonia sp. 22111]|uniref:DUF4145 domain-containing protein n=1 Tax=Ralstonia sp. 22111 TaxID=3453878 RepID=UPI003F8272CE